MEYLKRLEASEAELLERLKELISIRSVAEDAEGSYPFGAGVQKALDYFLNLGESMGFTAYDADHYGGHLEFRGGTFDDEGRLIEPAKETLGILVHLDVVPEGDGWETPPYEPYVAGGVLYGRGAEDDKGPAMAALFAMKALKDAGFRPKKNIRMILGLDEETDWIGMEHYLSNVAPPDFSFSPDADFPVICGEKGFLVFDLARKLKKSTEDGLHLRSISGGRAANCVPDRAKALLNGPSYEKVNEALDVFCERTGYSLTARRRGKSLEISAEGISAHGAVPGEGLNAISILMAFLGELNLAGEEIREFISFYNEKIGFETDGTSLGCGLKDDLSGGLVFNVGLVSMNEEAIQVTVNVRYPISADDAAVYAAMMPELNRYDIGVVKGSHKVPIYVPEDSRLVQTLLDVYRRQTGDTESRPLIIGGGTYARAVPNAVAFGALFPGTKETMHQPNECIPVENLMRAAKIYAEAIYELVK